MIFQPSWSAVTMEGNTFIGDVEGVDTSAYPRNAYLSGAPREAIAFVYPNEEQPGRALITVFNWSHADSVDVDLSSVLPAGTLYTVRRAQSYLYGPILDGEADGSPVALPMTHDEVAQPIGLPDGIDATELAGGSFDVFIVDGCAP